MRKILLLLAAAMTIGHAKADEGMWTMYDLDSTVYNIMVAEGFQLPYENLYSSPNAIKNCVVNFSGYCTGVVVSPNGLVFTNHHCGFSAINKHSTVEHDYMRNGFYAKSYAEELPNENMFVSFMKEQKDITARVESLIQGKGMAEQESIIDSLTTDWCSQCPSRWVSTAAKPTTGCGLDRLATSRCSASMPTPRPTDQPNTLRTTCPTTRRAGHPCRSKATRKTISR